MAITENSSDTKWIVKELVGFIDDQTKGLEQFKTRHYNELAELKRYVQTAEIAAGRAKLPIPGGVGALAKPTRQMLDVKSGKTIPVYGPTEHVASDGYDGKSQPSIGRVLRGLLLGGNAPDAEQLADERKALSIAVDPSGGYTVGGQLATSWIDLLRSEMVLSKAGATTVPMDGNSLTLAKVTSDPSCFWHAENADIADSEASFGAVTLTAKTVVCLVKLSLELSQDSANIEEILSSTINRSMAGAIDAAGLNGVGSGIAPSGLFSLPNRNIISAVGSPANYDFLIDGLHSLALANVPPDAVGAMVGHPTLWRKLAKLKTGIAGDQTSLVQPTEVARLPKLWTTAAPLAGNTAKAIMGYWPDLMFGVRKNISIKVLQEQYMASNLQLAVLAYARVDFAATRAQSFTTLEGITV